MLNSYEGVMKVKLYPPKIIYTFRGIEEKGEPLRNMHLYPRQCTVVKSTGQSSGPIPCSHIVYRSFLWRAVSFLGMPLISLAGCSYHVGAANGALLQVKMPDGFWRLFKRKKNETTAALQQRVCESE